VSQCEQPHCTEFRFDEDAAVRAGWSWVDGKWMCPFHGPMAALNHRRDLARTAQRVAQDASAAKRLFNAADYRAWDEFQSDLANFHRDHGKLAPKELRDMRPGEWVQQYRQLGRIDIEKSAEGLEKVAKAREAARQRLAGG
jgi:hypothetical protein